MTTTAAPRPAWPLVAFGAFASSAWLVGGLVVVPALETVADPRALAVALAVDLVVTVPAAYAALVVGARGGRWGSVVPVVALSAVGAWALVPEPHDDALAPLAVAVPALEAVALGAVAWALVRAARRPVPGDTLDRLRAATARVLGDGPAARAAAHELAVVRYALGPTAPPPPGAFPVRRSSGYGAVLAGFAAAAALELVGGHVLVSHFLGGTAALVHLVVSGYGVLWLVGDWRALGARVTRLDGDVLRVRCGLRASADVPVSAIETVYHVRRDLPDDRPTLVAVPSGRPRFALDLSRPVEAEGLLGRPRTVTRIALGADDPDRLLATLAEALGADPR